LRCTGTPDDAATAEAFELGAHLSPLIILNIVIWLQSKEKGWIAIMFSSAPVSDTLPSVCPSAHPPTVLHENHPLVLYCSTTCHEPFKISKSKPQARKTPFSPYPQHILGFNNFLLLANIGFEVGSNLPSHCSKVNFLATSSPVYTHP
jgi:hypothetical protein